MNLPVLNKRFLDLESFSPTRYQLLPFRFTRIEDDLFFASNMAGDFTCLRLNELNDLVDKRLNPDSDLFKTLVSKNFILTDISSAAAELLSSKYFARRSLLSEFTSLHMFVVTLRCDHSCPYCQVSRASDSQDGFDMTIETAEHAIDVMFQSPSQHLKVEFQGGESLLNFKAIKFIVEKVQDRAAVERRDVSFVVATNLSPIDGEILSFCKQYDISISTSLDGPEWLHNKNRPIKTGDSYERAIRGIEMCRNVLGADRVSALMTTTARSLSAGKQIVDEYLNRGFDAIFLRWLSPFGFAKQTASSIGYETQDWLDFYTSTLDYIIELNKSGIAIREDLASIVASKMISSRPSGYVDLQSPAGLGISNIVYNYDGVVYGSDESRMLAETGDKGFALGTLGLSSAREIYAGESLVEMLTDTMTDCTPKCVDCAFEPYCGTDPVYHKATQGSIYGHRPTSSYCRRNMGVFKKVANLLMRDDATKALLTRWSTHG